MRQPWKAGDFLTKGGSMGGEKRTTEGYDGRLRSILKTGAKRMSLRALGKELEARFPDVRGATYSSLRSYASKGGVQHPRLEVLRAISEVLDVRWEKLAFDQGAWTEEKEAFRVAVPQDVPGAVRAENNRRLMELSIAEVDAQLPDWFKGQLVLEYRHVSALIVNVAESFRRSDPDMDWEGCYQAAGRAVGRSIAAPLRELRAAIPPVQSRLGQLYATAATHALEVLADFAGNATDDEEA